MLRGLIVRLIHFTDWCSPCLEDSDGDQENPDAYNDPQGEHGDEHRTFSLWRRETPY